MVTKATNRAEQPVVDRHPVGEPQRSNGRHSSTLGDVLVYTLVTVLVIVLGLVLNAALRDTFTFFKEAFGF